MSRPELAIVMAIPFGSLFIQFVLHFFFVTRCFSALVGLFRDNRTTTACCVVEKVSNLLRWNPLIVRYADFLTGETLLYAAIDCGAPAEVVSLLFERNPKAAASRFRGDRTPLYAAVGNGRYCDSGGIVESLVRQFPGAMVIRDFHDGEGYTPLHRACTWGGVSLDIFRRMIRHGGPACCLVKDVRGRLPLDVARDQGYLDDDVVSFLEQTTKAAARTLLNAHTTAAAGLSRDIAERVAAFASDLPEATALEFFLPSEEIQALLQKQETQDWLRRQMPSHLLSDSYDAVVQQNQNSGQLRGGGAEASLWGDGDGDGDGDDWHIEREDDDSADTRDDEDEDEDAHYRRDDDTITMDPASQSSEMASNGMISPSAAMGALNSAAPDAAAAASTLDNSDDDDE